MAVLPDGGAVIADWGNFRIVWVDVGGKITKTSYGFKAPLSVVSYFGGHIFVVDEGNKDIRYIDSNSGQIMNWRVNYTFSAPSGLAMSGTWDSVISDRINNQVLWVHSSGGVQKVVGGFMNPMGVARTADGGVVVADYGSNRILFFDRDGNYVRALGGFSQPSGVAVDSDGGCIVANSGSGKIILHDSAGMIVKELDGFDRPHGVSLPVGVTSPEFC